MKSGPATICGNGWQGTRWPPGERSSPRKINPDGGLGKTRPSHPWSPRANLVGTVRRPPHLPCLRRVGPGVGPSGSVFPLADVAQWKSIHLPGGRPWFDPRHPLHVLFFSHGCSVPRPLPPRRTCRSRRRWSPAVGSKGSHRKLDPPTALRYVPCATRPSPSPYPRSATSSGTTSRSGPPRRCSARGTGSGSSPCRVTWFRCRSSVSAGDLRLPSS